MTDNDREHENLLTLEDAAKRAACTDEHLRNEWRAGRLDLVRLGARRLRVRASELDRWIKSLPTAIPGRKSA